MTPLICIAYQIVTNPRSDKDNYLALLEYINDK